MATTYNVQFDGITARFDSLEQASMFERFYREHTGVFLGIEADKPKARKVSRPAADLPERSEIDAQYADRVIRTKDDYFAACKRIALRDDLRFLVRVAGSRMSAEVRRDADALLAELEVRAGKPADAKAINQLRDRYRLSLPSLVLRPVAVSQMGAVA